MVNNTRTSEREAVKKAFRSLDTDKSGYVCMEDIKKALIDAGSENEKILSLIQNLDFEGTGQISYSSFLAATMDKREMICKENLRFAFHHFDSDHDGFISAENLIEAFHREGRHITEDDVYKMLDDAGLSRESKITFEEFERFMDYSSFS